MNTRSSTTSISHHPRSRPTSITPKHSSSNIPVSRTSSQSSQPRTSSRGDLPSNRMTVPVTPTPRKPRPRGKKGAGSSIQRKDEDQVPLSSEGDDIEIVQSGIEFERSSEDEELFGLLGVTSPPVEGSKGFLTKNEEFGRGILPISKADIDQSKTRGKRNGQAKDTEEGSSGSHMQSPTPKNRSRESRNGRNKQGKQTITSEGEALQPQPKRTRQPRKGAPSADYTPAAPSSIEIPSIVAPVPRNVFQLPAKPTTADTEGAAFDTTSLSQSLPSEGCFAPSKLGKSGKSKQDKKASEDPGAVSGENGIWDMPEMDGILGNHELTWQQKLGSYPHADQSPKRRSAPPTKQTKSRTTPHAPSPLNPSLLAMTNPAASASGSGSRSHPNRPSQNRRMSADSISSAPSRRSAPTNLGPTSHKMSQISSLDDIPFHTGFNVHRAPQTPAKMANGVVSDLPLQGEFPRLNQGGLGVHSGAISVPAGAGAMKYAGPTFHNSPHASSLPKPDMDDF